MYTLTGAVIGFVAMLAARGKAGIAAALAFLGLVLGIIGSVVFGVEVLWASADAIQANPENPDTWLDLDFSMGKLIAGGLAALPGVAGALLGRRD